MTIWGDSSISVTTIAATFFVRTYFRRSPAHNSVARPITSMSRRFSCAPISVGPTVSPFAPPGGATAVNGAAISAPPWYTGQQSPSPNRPAKKPKLSADAALPESVRRGFVRYRFSTSALLAARRWPLLCSCQSGTSPLRPRARVHRLVPSSTSVCDRVSVGSQIAVQGRARTPSSSPIPASLARRSD